MSAPTGCPEPAFRAGDEANGFRITRVTPIPEIRVTAYEATHLATGAKVLHLHCDDRENWYTVTFRTPPSDSTGVAHILEHSVLAGSEKYPVHDAFNELGKGTLRTFLNAFTAPDFTCYPVASQVHADFRNLASVYTDLVFHPLLKEQTFMQEGHHLEVDEDGALSLSGIVYNEMKGAFSSAESVASRATLQTLFPDTPYGVESGGDPDYIPDLTYKGFRDFHRRFYSATNARIFLYGDIPTAQHLAFLEERFRGHARIDVDSSVPLQAPWDGPREHQESFPVGPEDPTERKTIVNVAWLTAPMADGEERFVLEVLAEALVGNAAGPLRKALIESGLGEDLSPGTGLHTWYRQIPFVVGLRGTDPEQAAAIERLALDTLQAVARDGLPRDLLEAAFHQVEFKGREISQLRALDLLFRLMPVWLHDLDPLDPLRFPSLVDRLRGRWAREPELFSQAIRRWLVDNPHRLRAVITPSRTAAAEFDARVRARLEKIRSGMSAADVEKVRRAAEELREAQRAKDTPEALASLPQLRLEEVPRDADRIPTAERAEGPVRVYEHDIFTNGIGYLDLAFDVSDLPEEMQDLLPLFSSVATEMGAGGEDYAAFATRKALVTGGVGMELRARERAGGGPPLQILMLRASALGRNIPKMAQVVRDVLLRGDLDDVDRFRDVLAEERNGLRSALVPRGSGFALRAAAASISPAAWRDEQWHGVRQFHVLNRLHKNFDPGQEELRARLRALREEVFRRARLSVNLTGDEACLGALRAEAASLIGALPAGAAPAPAPAPVPAPSARGVAVPGKVCFVARVFPAPRYRDPAAPAVLTLANCLSDDILYKKVRVEGGAYGGMAMYNSNFGYVAFLSYRDPHLERTLETYDGVLAAFLAEPPDAETVRKTVIGTVADLDRPMAPAVRGALAFERLLIGVTDDERQRFREAVLAMTPEALQRAARETLLPRAAEARQAVLAPKDRIEAANRELGKPFEVETLD